MTAPILGAPDPGRDRAAPPTSAMIATLVGVTLKRLTRGKALWIAAGLAALPVVFAVVLQGAGRSASPSELFAPTMLLFAVLPALLVGASVGEEIEDRTSTYLWSRPIARWAVLAGKLCALTPIVIALIVGGWYAGVIIWAEAAPSLVAEEGPLGSVAPAADHRADIEQALKIVHALGTLDVGQAAVVCEGLALSVEAAEGTDAMLLRIPTLRESLRGTADKKRGVLAKALKPLQDAKTDMPVVGVQTVRNAHAAFLAGIAVEAGAALILHKQEVAAEADRLGLFVVGVKP